MASQEIYLDYSATTPIDERVLDAMMPYFSQEFGNTSSSHMIGRRAEAAIETARETIAAIFNCSPSEIIFTSGGSESDNLAIRGAAWHTHTNKRGNHLITSPVEHNAVTQTVAQLSSMMGFEQSILPVDDTAMIDPEELGDTIRDTTAIASIIYTNNEVGTVNPLPKLAEQCHARDVLFHTDAVQAAGQLPINVKTLGVDMMSISAHKFYGPKGVGALYVREGINLESSQTGGSHEQGRRAGTLNTPGIVGMAEALCLAYEENEERLAHYKVLRDKLLTEIPKRISDCKVTGHLTERLPSHASFVFAGIDSSKLLMHLDMKGVAASGGSACKTGNPEPSGVLLAMGYPESLAIGSLRLTVGKYTTEAEVDYAIEAVVSSVEKLRNLL